MFPGERWEMKLESWFPAAKVIRIYLNGLGFLLWAGVLNQLSETVRSGFGKVPGADAEARQAHMPLFTSLHFETPPFYEIQNIGFR